MSDQIEKIYYATHEVTDMYKITHWELKRIVKTFNIPKRKLSHKSVLFHKDSLGKILVAKKKLDKIKSIKSTTKEKIKEYKRYRKEVGKKYAQKIRELEWQRREIYRDVRSDINNAETECKEITEQILAVQEGKGSHQSVT